MTTRAEKVQALDTLLAGLATLRGMYDQVSADAGDHDHEEKPDAAPDEAMKIRGAAAFSLQGVIAFIDQMSPDGRLTFGLYPLLRALEEIESGHRVPWLENGKPSPPVTELVAALRKDCGAVMEILITEGGERRDDAANLVLRWLSPRTSRLLGKAGKAATTGQIKGWRDAMFPRDFEPMLKRRRAYKSLPVRDYARLTLEGVSKHGDAQSFEKTPVYS